MTTQDGGWLTIRDASLSLGVSELTIRRRIKAGRVAFRLDGGKYYVNLSEPQPGKLDAAPHEPGPAEPEPPPAAAGLEVRSAAPPSEQLFAEYGRLAERAGRAAALEEAVRRLEEQRTSLEQSLVALAGRNGWLESRLEEREKELRLLSDSETRPGFWRRLFGRGEAASG